MLAFNYLLDVSRGEVSGVSLMTENVLKWFAGLTLKPHIQRKKNHESKLLRNTLSNCTNSCPSILYLKEMEGREEKANIGSGTYLLKWLV